MDVESPLFRIGELYPPHLHVTKSWVCEKLAHVYNLNPAAVEFLPFINAIAYRFCKNLSERFHTPLIFHA